MEDLGVRVAKSVHSLSHVYVFVDDGAPGYWAASRREKEISLEKLDHEMGFGRLQRLVGHIWDRNGL